MNRSRIAGAMTGFAVALFCPERPALAEGVILSITGRIEGESARFTRAELEAFEQHSLQTSTSVTDGVREFEGFLMRDLMAAVGATGDSVEALALNGYQIAIPIADFERFDVLGALSMDGARLSPRDKGPIWIVYPRDAHLELDDIRYDMRWVWQLQALDVR
ncbi:hypothetical protein [Alkalilacustris brevis]|uniref:hypothetical protein n=1 Tax=Alkalilacustris brevis TaxID=2026338 RepID=UPI000E0D6D0D|nr:hypothetical protein [Alkalilacustris brevis]